VAFSQILYDRLVEQRAARIRQHAAERVHVELMDSALSAMADTMRFLGEDELLACLLSEVGPEGVERFLAIRSGDRLAAA
jgi:hypothetical protein